MTYFTTMTAVIDRAATLVDAREPGYFTVPELFGDDWRQVCQHFRPQDIGREFQRAVDGGRILNVRFEEIQRSPRMSIWEKLGPHDQGRADQADRRQ